MSHKAPQPPVGSLWAVPDAKALSRRTDPATSKAAAVAVLPRIGDLQAKVLEVVRANPGRTRNELAAVMGWHPSEVSKRLPELERVGLVRRGAERDCNVTGRSCAVWEVA